MRMFNLSGCVLSGILAKPSLTPAGQTTGPPGQVTTATALSPGQPGNHGRNTPTHCGLQLRWIAHSTFWLRVVVAFIVFLSAVCSWQVFPKKVKIPKCKQVSLFSVFVLSEQFWLFYGDKWVQATLTLMAILTVVMQFYSMEGKFNIYVFTPAAENMIM